MDEKHQALIDQVNRISPLNPVMLDLLAALQNEDSQASDLRRIIESDANTSATILKIANSPFYGMSGRIHSVQDACVLLGYDQLKNIIYATALEEATNKGPHVKWRHQLRCHTVATAIICSELGRYDAATKGKGYASGLLHELGKQVILAEFPDEFSEYMAVADSEEANSFNQLFAEMGDVLGKRWRLSQQVFKVFLDCVRRIPVMRPVFLETGQHQRRLQVDQIQDEVIGMLGNNVVGLQAFLRKIF